MLWGWNFAQIIGDGRSTKVAKMMVVHWRLTFLRWSQVCFPIHLYGPQTFVVAKCWEFQTTSPLKPPGQCCSYFMWNLLGAREQKIATMVTIRWQMMAAMPSYCKIFKSLLVQSQISTGALPLHKSSGTGGLPKLIKWWSYIDAWPFYGKIKFDSPCILYGNNVGNSYFGHLL